MKPEIRWVASLLLAPLLGVLCFLAPILVAGDTDVLASPESVSIISRIFENTTLPATVVLLVLSGFGLRYFVGRGTLVFPVLLIAPFPIATAVDVVMNPYTHNLLPFELAIQLACIVPPLLGAFAASMLTKRKQAAHGV
jgi:hypothetical protein